MMFQYMTLTDETEITHSELLPNGDVKVYIEKPDAELGFLYATCYLPAYKWSDIFGFSNEEIQNFQKLIENNAHLILEFASKGGFENASNF